MLAAACLFRFMSS